jgi:hypothetical protein
VRLWDATTGNQVGDPLTGNWNRVLTVAFSADGKRIISGGGDGTLRLWPAFPDAVSALCAKLSTNLGRKQWRDWVSPDIDYIKACNGLPIPADG